MAGSGTGGIRFFSLRLKKDIIADGDEVRWKRIERSAVRWVEDGGFMYVGGQQQPAVQRDVISALTDTRSIYVETKMEMKQNQIRFKTKIDSGYSTESKKSCYGSRA